MVDISQQALLDEFVAENREALQQIEQGVLALENSLGDLDTDTLQLVFRAMHTIKGNCLMLGFAQLETITHAAEDLLAGLREFRFELDVDKINILLQVVDQIKKCLDVIVETGAEPVMDHELLLSQLVSYQHEDSATDFLQSEISGSSVVADGVEGNGGIEESGATVMCQDSAGEGFIRLPFKRIDDVLNALASTSAALGQWRNKLKADNTEVARGLEDVGQQLVQLQDQVLRYRLEPIGHILQPYQRLVRDLAVATKKRVLLTLDGEDTEVDRAVLMTIKDPLGHLLRNAIDHGIESPAVRQSLGKPAIASLKLRAWQQHGRVMLEVEDDGCGLDVERIKQKAFNNGLISKQQMLSMDREAIHQLIFIPGFSTNEQVNSISGRGTGLDVVKTALDQVGGELHITSEVGKGCCFRLSIPQTMAMVPTLLLQSGKEHYALPQSQVIEVLGFSRREIPATIRSNVGQPAIDYRDKLIPLVPLGWLLQCSHWNDVDAKAWLLQLPRLELVLVHHNGRQLALQVDQVNQVASLVIKPLQHKLLQVPVLSGSTQLAGGELAFLLDVAGLMQCLDGGNYSG
ncbi:MAG: chemotaxis protein CheW [Thermodesulfobacteriota bacterium]|nr:chemotaxis protein CheW [Thermodesulfobacteriota bacterium]